MRFRNLIFSVLLLIIFTPLAIQAVNNQEVAPPINLQAFDTPNDAGKSITLTWQKSSDDGTGKNNVVAYKILRATSPDIGFAVIDSVAQGTEFYTDKSVEDGIDYHYLVRVVLNALYVPIRYLRIQFGV